MPGERTLIHAGVVVTSVALIAAGVAGGIGLAGCSTECIADRPPLIRLDDATYVVDLGGPAQPARPDASALLVIQQAANARTDACDWTPQNGESNFPTGTEVFQLDDGTYVVNLAQRYYVLRRQ